MPKNEMNQAILISLFMIANARMINIWDVTVDSGLPPNKWCQTWDVKNLFIADGAPFPSNADKNPTLTIMANAWRVTDHILERMRKKEL